MIRLKAALEFNFYITWNNSYSLINSSFWNIYWCGNVVIDRQFDQLGKVLVCVSAVTIRHRGRATL